MSLPKLPILREDFEKLSEYSTSLPTGTTVGKRWRRGDYRNRPTTWIIGEYVEDPRPNTVGIRWYIPEIIEPEDALQALTFKRAQEQMKRERDAAMRELVAMEQNFRGLIERLEHIWSEADRTDGQVVRSFWQELQETKYRDLKWYAQPQRASTTSV